MVLPLLIAMSAAQLPLPSPRQLEWQGMETNAFVHFGPNTFTDVEWGGGNEDPNLFDPSDLDCDGWVRTLKAAGFKGVILTAKHHDGFCLWPSKLSTHTVAQSRWRDGKGDVVRELSAACRRGGLKFGVYLSPWDRNHPAYGTPEYNRIFAGMLEEVLTHYGPIFEVWFDGANGEGPNGKKQVYDWDLFVRTVRRCQPRAVIFSDAGPDVRWVGNEQGFAGETCWSTIPSGRYHPGTPLYAELTEGRPDGDLWVPAECDVSIRPGWFYHADQDAKVRTPENLLDLWERSVGRNGQLLLNVPPDRGGRFADADVRALEGFAALKNRIYGHDLARGGRIDPGHGHLRGRNWEGETGDGPTSLFGAPRRFDRVELRELIADGQRVAAFTVEARVGGAWREIAKGTTIGHRRILRVAPTEADAVRVRIDAALAPPRLLALRLYDAGVGPVAAEAPSGERQASDGSLVLRPEPGHESLKAGEEASWRFEAVRGEVRVRIEATPNAVLQVELGGQPLRGRVPGSGLLDLGRAAIVVGGPTTLTLKVVRGTTTVRSVRLLPAE